MGNITRSAATLFLVLASLATSAAEIPSFSTCSQTGGDITSARGRVTSPNYPDEYPRNLDCTWNVVSPKGAGLRLTIEHLDNQEVFDNGNVCNDKLRIASVGSTGRRQDLDADEELCAKRVGELRKTTFEIPNSGAGVVKAHITFKADYDDQGTGFSILFEALCNRTLTGESGTITSPNFPGLYPDNADCYTEIRAPYGTTILLNFLQINVERQVECQSDYVAVSEGSPGLYGIQPKKYCSNDLGIVSINSHIATVRFVSDDRIALSGFSASWKAVFPTTTPAVQATTVEMKNCSYTNESILCQRWDVTVPHKPKYYPDDTHHNFCRNPDNDVRGFWCYTSDPDKRWGYCDIDTCVPVTQPATTVPAATTQPDIPPTTARAPEALLTTTIKNDATSSIFGVVGVGFGASPSADKQVSDDDLSSGGVPWFVFVIAVAVLVVIFIVVLAVVLRYRRARKASVTISEPIMPDTVAFSQLDRDACGERPRENTYVEIPFLGSANDDDIPTRGADQGGLDVCGKGFVHLNERQSNSSVSSLDSMKLAKEAAQRRFMSDRGASTSSDANPYSVAEDVREDRASSMADRKSSGPQRATQLGSGTENVYDFIETPQGSSFAGVPLPPPPVEKENTPFANTSSKNKPDDRKFLKKASKSSLPLNTGFANPTFRETDNTNGFTSGEENPFDTDDESSGKRAAAYQLSPGNPFKSDSARAKEEYNLYNAPSVIPSLPAPTTLKVEDEGKKHSSFDSPYMMPKFQMLDKVPNDAEMICISPDLIDDKGQTNAFESDFVLYSSPTNPTSPVFELQSDENFTYAAPRDARAAGSGSFSGKSDSDGSARSARDSGNASLSAIESIPDDKQEYCVMGSITNLNLREKKEKPASESSGDNRLSQLYLSMKGIQTDRRVSEASGKATKNQTSKPRQSL